MPEKGLQDRIASKNEYWKKQILKRAHKMMKKTSCTRINLRTEEAAYNGTLLFAENQAIKVAVRKI